jgi:3-isopropylmalate/(R)-2-methylmalate dehydratase small subunit
LGEEQLILEGRVWLFEEANINTDLIMPQTVFNKPIEEQIKYIFSVNRPGWTDLVRQGDILVAGKNFGTGSSRPGALLFKRLGISAIVAESINGLFYRNCINYALPAVECPGVTKVIREGDIIRINVNDGIIDNLTAKKQIQGHKTPEFLMNIIKSGGILENLKKEGYLVE